MKIYAAPMNQKFKKEKDTVCFGASYQAREFLPLWARHIESPIQIFVFSIFSDSLSIPPKCLCPKRK